MGILSREQIRDLKIKANDIRKSIIEMLSIAKAGHTAGSLGMADIFTYLFFQEMKHKPENPLWEERDRLLISNGHICPVYYACLAHRGYIGMEELKTLGKFGSKLQGHPDRKFLPFVETSSGPLGEGLSQAVGMAISAKIDKLNIRIYCTVGDGELDEGENWEAIMLASKYHLDNLILIVDRNNIQLSGNTENIMPLNNIPAKFESFNWNVKEIDGNNMQEIEDAFYDARHVDKDMPIVIIAKTIAGKGVKEFEDNYLWHGKAPNDEEARRAMIELNSNLYA